MPLCKLGRSQNGLVLLIFLLRDLAAALAPNSSPNTVELADFARHMIGLYDSLLDHGDAAAFELFWELVREDHEGRPGVGRAELHPQRLSAECNAWVSYYDRDGNGILSEAEFVPFARELRLWLVSARLNYRLHAERRLIGWEFCRAFADGIASCQIRRTRPSWPPAAPWLSPALTRG